MRFWRRKKTQRCKNIFGILDGLRKSAAVQHQVLMSGRGMEKSTFLVGITFIIKRSLGTNKRKAALPWSLDTLSGHFQARGLCVPARLLSLALKERQSGSLLFLLWSPLYGTSFDPGTIYLCAAVPQRKGEEFPPLPRKHLLLLRPLKICIMLRWTHNWREGFIAAVQPPIKTSIALASIAVCTFPTTHISIASLDYGHCTNFVLSHRLKT